MPELPDMEVYRRQLETRCHGRSVIDAEVTRPRSLNIGVGKFRKAIQGARLAGFGRTGKQFVFHLSNGAVTPFFAGDPFTGRYLPHLKVYDRKGEPCPRCGAAIAFMEASGRKLFFCPACQKRGEQREEISVAGDRPGAAVDDVRVHPG